MLQLRASVLGDCVIAVLECPPKATSGFFMVFEEHMKRALELAASALGQTRTNPLVGAVIVKDGQAIAEGFHRCYGADHAEVDAINRAGDKAAGADMYVTLEPCVHFGKTPPCVHAIKAAGIQRVVVATLDPNPIVNGAGIRSLQEAGIEVDLGVCEEDAKRLNEAYFKFITTGMPFVTVKIAQTIDGVIADAANDSKWITSEEARHRVHVLRSSVDAVLVGAATARIDDPELSSHGLGRDPLRVVLTKSGDLPDSLNIHNPRTGGKTIVVIGSEKSVKPECTEGHTDSSLIPLLKEIASEGVAHLLVEGGGSVFSQFIESGLVDRFIFVIAPKLLGSGKPVFRSRLNRSIMESLPLRFTNWEPIGGDLWVEAYPG